MPAALLGRLRRRFAQELWLKADLAANASKNVIALWHKPRYSSGQTNLQALQPLWDDLYAAGVDILLDGHDHIYERIVPMKSGATLSDPPVADPTYGIQQFTVGTGGEAHHGLGTTLPTSVVRNDTDFGIMKFTLHATTYDWVFLPIAGSTFTDSGTGTVHAAPTTNHAPMIDQPGAQQNSVGELRRRPLIAADQDGDPLTFELPAEPCRRASPSTPRQATSAAPSHATVPVASSRSVSPTATFRPKPRSRGPSTRPRPGYWMVASTVASLPSVTAGFFGSNGGHALDQPVVGMAPTPTGRGLLVGRLRRWDLHLR